MKNIMKGIKNERTIREFVATIKVRFKVAADSEIAINGFSKIDKMEVSEVIREALGLDEHDIVEIGGLVETTGKGRK